MKLVFLNMYAGSLNRGAESFSEQLIVKMRKNLGYEVELIKGYSSVMPTHEFTGNFWAKMAKRFFLDKPSRQVGVFTLKILLRLIAHKPNWVIPMNGFWQVIILKLLQPFFKYKLLITGHSGPGWDERWNLYLHPNVFVATTQPSFQWAKKIAPWTRVELIPYGVNPDIFTDPPESLVKSVKKQFSILEKPLILCPAALVPYKRVDLAIKAVAKLKRGSLIILGSGPLQTQLCQLAQQLIPQRHLMTSVTYDQVPAYFKLADVITLPSSPQENSPMVFIEALAAHKPIVTTDAPRVRWALDQSGIYIDPMNVDEYAQSLLRAIQMPINSTPALKKFLWPQVLKKYQTVLEQAS